VDHYGLRVPYQETLDPLGNIAITIKDAWDRERLVLRKNRQGAITQKTEYHYDTNDNLTRIIETVIAEGLPERQIITQLQYDQMNREIAHIQALNTPEQQTTTFSYDPSGRLQTKTKPDGVVLYHEYDQLGRLSVQKSSDGTIHYHYAYDRKGNLLRADDCLT
jgi:YD repeat-containing protein